MNQRGGAEKSVRPCAVWSSTESSPNCVAAMPNIAFHTWKTNCIPLHICLCIDAFVTDNFLAGHVARWCLDAMCVGLGTETRPSPAEFLPHPKSSTLRRKLELALGRISKADRLARRFNRHANSVDSDAAPVQTYAPLKGVPDGEVRKKHHACWR